MIVNHKLAAELGAGYRRTPYSIMEFIPLSNHVVVQEKLLDDTIAKLILLRKGNAVLGTVMAVGAQASAEGITPGDLVVYTEWQGGRWSFPEESIEGGELRTLILRAEDVLVRIPFEDAPTTHVG